MRLLATKKWEYPALGIVLGALATLLVIIGIEVFGDESNVYGHPQALDLYPPPTTPVHGEYTFVPDLCDAIDWSPLGGDTSLSDPEHQHREDSQSVGNTDCAGTSRGDFDISVTYFAADIFASSGEAKTSYEDTQIHVSSEFVFHAEAPWDDGYGYTQIDPGSASMGGKLIIGNLVVVYDLWIGHPDGHEDEIAEIGTTAPYQLAEQIRLLTAA